MVIIQEIFSYTSTLNIAILLFLCYYIHTIVCDHTVKSARRKKAMPLVRATVDLKPNGVFLRRGGRLSSQNLLKALRHACGEIVPAGMSSPSKPIQPGDIQFVPVAVLMDGSLTVNVLIEIEALWKEDRENVDERASEILGAMKQLFPALTFEIWITLVRAGAAGDSMPQEGDFDMSMEAAIARVRLLGYDS